MITEQHMAVPMNSPGSVVVSSHAASDGFSVSTMTVTVLPGPNVSTYSTRQDEPQPSVTGLPPQMFLTYASPSKVYATAASISHVVTSTARP